MDKVIDFTYHYPGFGSCHSKCRLRCFTGDPTASPVVILTELPENEGTSITNMIEYLATVSLILLPKGYPPAVIFEHYREGIAPSRDPWGEGETFDRVLFSEDAPPFGKPRWQISSRRVVESWIGGPLLP